MTTLFPTRLRVRISSKLSYPCGAEQISSQLEGAPQAGEFEIYFFNRYERMETRGEPYSIFNVAYSPTGFSQGWTIEVRPVPRLLKHAIKEALINEAFPRIRDWLKRHGEITSKHAWHSFSVIFDEKAESSLRFEEEHRF